MDTNQPEDIGQAKAENKSKARLNERFVRWQAELRQSLTGHVALIVAFSSGGLAFVGSILNDDHANFSGHASYVIIAAGVLFLVSLFLALLISCNRLIDVRKTLEILKDRKDEKPSETIQALRTRTKQLGKWTWTLVYSQLVAFAVASALFCAGIFLAFEHRLFPDHHCKGHSCEPPPKFFPVER
jgi:uncharacterized membrane protein YhaH (DUF805 family)